MGPGVGGGDGKTALLTFFIGQLTDGCLGSGPGVVITVLVQQTAEHPRGVGYVCGAARGERIRAFPGLTLTMVKTF